MNTPTKTDEYTTRITFAKEPKLESTKPFKADAAYAVEIDACYDKFLFIVHGDEQSVAIRRRDVLSLVEALKEAVAQGVDKVMTEKGYHEALHLIGAGAVLGCEEAARFVDTVSRMEGMLNDADDFDACGEQGWRDHLGWVS